MHASVLTVGTLSLALVILSSPASARQAPVGSAGSALAAAKALYATASYEEALSRLSRPDGSDNADEVEQYRALCYLALGRTEDAERSLEQIVSRAPLYSMSDTDVSPRLVTLFHDVRKRLLPAAAKDLYTTAKTSFDAKNYATASAQLKQVLAVLADGALVEQASSLADLKMLAEGFLRLSEAEVAAAAKAAVPPPAPAPSPASPPAAPAAQDSAPLLRIYSTADRDIVPPLELERKLPAWVPPNPVAQRTLFRGVVEVIIDEKGAVESAVLREPVSRYYDAALLESTKTWKFRPANRGGLPVKYRMLFEVVLRPSGES
jgi:TonB family protein